VGRHPGLKECHRMVQPRRKYRRWAAVVLRGAEHDDRTRATLLITLPLLVNSDRGVTDDQGGASGRRDPDHQQVAQDGTRSQQRNLSAGPLPRGASFAVALLVLGARAAPAGIVPA